MAEQEKKTEASDTSDKQASENKGETAIVGEVIDEQKELTKRKKAVFLEMFDRSNCRISVSCKIAGIARETYYDWRRKESPRFDPVFDEACRTIISHQGDRMEELLISNAENGNVAAQIFWLKSKHPDYLPKSATLVQVEGKSFEDVIKQIAEGDDQTGIAPEDNPSGVSDTGQAEAGKTLPAQPGTVALDVETPSQEHNPQGEAKGDYKNNQR